jgi:E3 ubiquitin-protein ligase SHPRH
MGPLFEARCDIRLRYFRQLQDISDTVMEVEWEGLVEDAIQENNMLQTEITGKIKTARARQRYVRMFLARGAA